MKRTALSRRPSARKLAFDAEYAKVLPGVLSRKCEWADYVLASYVLASPGPSLGVVCPEHWHCDGRLVGHHAKGRQAADANEPENLRCLCSEHHTFVHAHPRWAREVGLMLSRTS